MPTSSKRRLSNSYEHLYHLVKSKDYYVNQDAFRTYKRNNINSKTLTGVNEFRYLRKIKDSTYLNDSQKELAVKELNETLTDVRNGVLVDFRMLLKGDNSVINGPLSKRNKEINVKGFVILKYKDYSMLSDVWDISPNKEGLHNSPFPHDLCLYPIVATCHKNGLVLDPFCGSGTTNLVAKEYKRNSIGIDISLENIDLCKKRILCN